MIRIAPIGDRTGQRLYNKLRDRLNPGGEAANPLYELRVSLTSSVQNLAIRKDEVATRANYHVTASYRLQLRKTGKILIQGTSRSVNSFNILHSYFSTLSSKEDARRRAVEVIADEIRNRIGIFLNRSARSGAKG